MTDQQQDDTRTMTPSKLEQLAQRGPAERERVERELEQRDVERSQVESLTGVVEPL